MNSPTLLSAYERCNRLGIWSRDWEKTKVDPKEILAAGIKEGLTTNRQDFGDAAGECIIGIGRDREVSADNTVDQYGTIIHCASLADIVTSAIRKPHDAPWLTPDAVDLGDGVLWNSGCFLAPSGRFLRRVALVSSWNEDRHYGEIRGWGTLGEVCCYNLPMQLVVVIVGPYRSGKFSSAWTKGFRHPVNRGLRFKKKSSPIEGFKSSWTQVAREDYDEISTSQWLESMIKDEVLKDLCFRVDIPVPDDENRERIVTLFMFIADSA